MGAPCAELFEHLNYFITHTQAYYHPANKPELVHCLSLHNMTGHKPIHGVDEGNKIYIIDTNIRIIEGEIEIKIETERKQEGRQEIK